MHMIRTITALLLTTVSAVAFHEHTFAVFELRELLLMRTMNLWELFDQLEYVEPHQRAIVYQEIESMKQEIVDLIDQLLQHDRSQHP